MGVKKTQTAVAVLTDKLIGTHRAADQQHADKDSPWIDVRESSRLLDCHPYHVYRLAKKGDLQYKRSRRRGRGWQFLRTSVISLAKKGS